MLSLYSVDLCLHNMNKTQKSDIKIYIIGNILDSTTTLPVDAPAPPTHGTYRQY